MQARVHMLPHRGPSESGLWMTGAHAPNCHNGAGAARREGQSQPMAQRFLTLADVAEVLNISASQTYALVRSGELEAIKVGGRGQWRVESDKLESYIARMYDETRRFVVDHPFVDNATPNQNA